jgi:hypothetical protein
MRRIALALLSVFFISAAFAQSAPPTMPDRSVYGRLGSGTGSGPGQAIPFATLSPYVGGTYPGSITLNVDHTLGVDQNGCGNAPNGAGACKTILYAYQRFQTNVKVGPAGTATIQSDCGFTETPSGAFLGPSSTGGSGGGVVFIIGNQSSPASCTWTSAGWSVDDGAVISLRGFKTINASTGQTWLSVTKMGLVVFTNMLWGSAVNGAHVSLTDGGVLVAEAGGTYQVGAIGDACLPSCFNYHVINNGGSFEFGGQTITVPAALTFNAWYAGQGSGANGRWGTNTFSGAGSGSGSTGAQYSVIDSANLQTGSTTLPGLATSNLIATNGCVNKTCVPGPIGTVSALPTCNAQSAGAVATVTDANGQFWGGQPSGGSSAILQEYCNGSVWSISGGGESTASAAYVNTGTSGGTVPLLNGNNIFSGTSTFSNQIISASGTPTIASGACGTGANGAVVLGSTNQSGSITIGASATTTCTISWSATLATAPNACVFFPMNATAAATGTTLARNSAPTTSQVVLTGGALANANYGYVCL